MSVSGEKRKLSALDGGVSGEEGEHLVDGKRRRVVGTSILSTGVRIYLYVTWSLLTQYDLILPKDQWTPYQPLFAPHFWTKQKLFEFWTVPQNTPRWMELRAEVIGSSTLSGLVGANEHISQRDAMLMALKAYTPGYHEDPHDIFEHGHEIEEVAAVMFEQLYSVVLDKVGIAVNNEWSILGASCDRIIREEKNISFEDLIRKVINGIPFKNVCVVEIKSPIYWVHERIPIEYMIQMFEQMYATGAKRAFFVSMFVPRTLSDPMIMRVWRVQWNDDYWNEIECRLREVLFALFDMDVDRKFDWLHEAMPPVQIEIDETFNLDIEDVVWACNKAGIKIPKGWFDDDIMKPDEEYHEYEEEGEEEAFVKVKKE